MFKTVREFKKAYNELKGKHAKQPYPKPTDFPMKKAGDLERLMYLHANMMREWQDIPINLARIDVKGTYISGEGYRTTNATKGVSDTWMTLYGCSICVEVKWKKDVVSDVQKKFRRKQEAAGGQYYIVSTPEEWFILIDRLVGLASALWATTNEN